MATGHPPVGSNIVSGANSSDLPSVKELEDYGAIIVKELDKAETSMEDSDNQPFSGMSSAVMRDIAHLRNEQFDMFRRHVAIEQEYKIHGSAADTQNMTFSGIATTMRKKEVATAGLLNRLASFDAQLRSVMDKFEPNSNSTSPPNSRTTAEHETATASTNQPQHNTPHDHDPSSSP